MKQEIFKIDVNYALFILKLIHLVKCISNVYLSASTKNLKMTLVQCYSVVKLRRAKLEKKGEKRKNT